MKRVLLALLVGAGVAIAAFAGQTQPPPPKPQQPPPTADPYATNPDAGASKFPLAAPAGKDSNARTTPLAGAVNQGPFDPATWKYGPSFTPPTGTKIWNP
ncbi:MAG: hypothetical protein HY654_13100, partial [Acidobacteria bacterium]|nr:hypothetical protein [Acidobacteriota bacterium]